MPRERVRFTDGVTRLEGAPLSAPYDLRNAELMNNSGVRALEAPSEPSSGTPGAVDQEWFRHGSFWRSGRSAEQVGRTLYVSENDSSGDPIYQEYINTAPNAKQNVPQVTSVETREGNIPVDTAVTEERYVYYLLVPINDDGEAGPYARCGAKVPSSNNSGQLPVLEVKGNDALKNVEVYRTPLFKKTPIEGATGLFYLGRFSESSSIDSSSSVTTYYTIPDLDSTDDYIGSTDNRLFLAGNDWEERNGGDANLVSFNDPEGWRIRFNYLILDGETTTASAGGIEPGKVYTITQLGFDDDQPWIRFEDPDTGNVVSFNPVVLFDVEVLAATFLTAVQGVAVDYLPPAGAEGDRDTFTVIDDKQWRLDITEIDGEKKTPEAPTTQSFDRPLNVFAAESSDAVESAENYTLSTQSNIRYPKFRQLDYNGGIMYGASPTWPTAPPQPSLVQGGGDQDVKLQFEYEIEGNRFYGPPTYIEGPTEIGCQWHGLEDKLNVFVTDGQKFDITNAQVNKDVLRVFDDTNSFGDIAPVGSVIDIVGTGTSADGQDIVRALNYDSTSNEQDVSVDGKIPSGITQGEIQFSDGFTLDTWDTSGDTITINETGSNIQQFVGQPSFVEIQYSTDGTLTNLQTGTFAISSIDIGSSTTDLNLVSLDDDLTNISGFVTVFAEYSILGSQSNDDYFDIDDGSDDAFNTLTSGSTFDVIESNESRNNKTYTLTQDPTQPSSGTTRLTVEHIPVDNTSGKALIGTWALWDKISPNDDGTYSVDGKGLIWDNESPSDFIYQEDSPGLVNYVSEQSKVFLSNINRQLEMTFDQFRVPKGSVVRDIFRARLAEEEGLRSYDFYVASGDAIYVAQPSPADRTVALSAVTTSFGIAENQYQKTIRAILPSGAMVYGTDGRVYKMSGRQVQPVFLDESEPFSTIRDMAYDVEEGVIWMASDTGVWGFDNQRTRIQLQYDYDVTHLVYDEKNEATFGYNDSTDAWILFDRSGGARLNPSVTTQSITEGGQESQVQRLKADYSERYDGAYNSGDKSTYIRMRHAIDAPGVAGIENDVDVSTSDIDAVYRLPKREVVYPRLRGYAHQFKIVEFEELDELILDIQDR